MPASPDAPAPPPLPFGQRVLRILASLVILATSLAAALGLGEMLVRYVAPQQLILRRPDLFQPDDTLGWIQRRNVNAQVNTGERTVRVLTDSQGFRVGSRGRVESGTRVLLIGDSFMEALQVEYEQSLAGLLESHLSQALGAPVAVRNAAVGGWDPDQYLLQLRRSLAHENFSFAIVAIYFGNDILASRRDRVPARQPTPVHALSLPRHLSWREFVDAILYPVHDFLEVRSQLFILGKTRLHNTLVRLGLTSLWFPPTLLRSTSADPMWVNTADICADMASLARTHNMPIVFLLLPDAAQVEPGRLTEEIQSYRIDPRTLDIDQPSRRMGELMSTRGLLVVDATDTLRAAARNGTQMFGKIDSHLNAAGHSVVEAYLEPVLVTILRASRTRAVRYP